MFYAEIGKFIVFFVVYFHSNIENMFGNGRRLYLLWKVYFVSGRGRRKTHWLSEVISKFSNWYLDDHALKKIYCIYIPITDKYFVLEILGEMDVNL